MKYLVYLKIRNTKIQSVIPATSAEQAKEAFLKQAQERFMPGTYYHQDIQALKPEHLTAEEFWQGMSEEDADHICNPKYQAALLQGGDAVLWYFMDEILERYAEFLVYRAADLLGVDGYRGRAAEVLAREISCCNAHTFFQIFEIPEIDGETYIGFWQPFYEACQNGQLAALKGKLIEALNEL